MPRPGLLCRAPIWTRSVVMSIRMAPKDSQRHVNAQVEHKFRMPGHFPVQKVHTQVCPVPVRDRYGKKDQPDMGEFLQFFPPAQ